MELIHVIILSVVEGITEFLPISSTGHLILASDLLNIPQTEFLKSFEIFIQLGAIAAVFVLYFKVFLNRKNWPQIIIGFIPTATVGLVLYQFIKSYLLGNSAVTVAALFLGGIGLILAEINHKDEGKIDKTENISYKTAFLIGVVQSISVIPGVSRAAATIFGGMFLGLKRKTAVEFSFLLALPTMVGATGLDFFKSYKLFKPEDFYFLAIGFILSFVIAILSIKFLLKYIQNHSFIPFGIYRILIALAFLFFIIL